MVLPSVSALTLATPQSRPWTACCGPLRSNFTKEGLALRFILMPYIKHQNGNNKLATKDYYNGDHLRQELTVYSPTLCTSFHVSFFRMPSLVSWGK